MDKVGWLRRRAYDYGTGAYVDSALRRFLNTMLPPVTIARIITTAPQCEAAGMTGGATTSYWRIISRSSCYRMWQ